MVSGLGGVNWQPFVECWILILGEVCFCLGAVSVGGVMQHARNHNVIQIQYKRCTKPWAADFAKVLSRQTVLHV